MATKADDVSRRGPTDLVLTAANRGQAIAMRRRLDGDAERQGGGADRLEGRALVVPDAGGRRIGSGTATLRAIEAWRRRLARSRRETNASDDLRHRRLAIVHSGGDSRRLPAYAAEGKIFAPLPSSDVSPFPAEAPGTVFDGVLEDLESFEWPAGGGVVICSGDVVLALAAQRLSFSSDGVEAVAMPGPVERGAGHGVFAVERGRVRAMLQKPDAQTCARHDVVDSSGRVSLDTGIVALPWPIALRWLELARTHGLLGDRPPQVDLYADLLPRLAEELPEAGPAAQGPARSFLEAIRSERAVAGFSVQSVPSGRFRHVGTTRELLAETAVASRPVSDDAAPFRIDSPWCEGSTGPRDAFVDRCGEVELHLGHEALAVGVPGGIEAAVAIPDRTGLVVVPMRPSGHAAIAFGLDDDFKSARGDSGTFAGRPLKDLAARCWSEADERSQTLWNARLWRRGPAEESVRHALATARCEVDLEDGLLSAAEVFAAVDHRRLETQRRRCRRDAATRALAERDLEPVAEARWARAAADVAESAESRMQCRARAFAAVTRAAIESCAAADRADPSESGARFGSQLPREVRVGAPARIDLGGGWTDTPPICLEVGGTVLNLSVEVEGTLPIEAVARRIETPVVRLVSEDLAGVSEIGDAAGLLRPSDPTDGGDWALLPRTVVAMALEAELAGGTTLAEHLERDGGGIELRLSSSLPKGSGLGTSSILGASAIAAVHRLRGRSLDRDRLVIRTTALEQRMGTAGGWQDQAGGLTGGCKLLRTAPGLDQIPHEVPVGVSDAFWHERVLIHSTGIQRLARNILQEVVWRWLGGGRRMRRIARELQAGAVEGYAALAAGEFDRFAATVGEYWRLKRELDPGSSTPQIDAMVEPVSDLLSAWELPGAGGGGFLFMIARDGEAAQEIRRRFTARPPQAPDAGGGFIEVVPSARGLTIEVDGEN